MNPVLSNDLPVDLLALANGEESGSNLEQDCLTTTGTQSSNVGVTQGQVQAEELYNSKPFSSISLKREKPEHREMIYLKLQGYTHKEIAETMGVTPMTVSNVMRQPWARTYMSEQIERRGGDKVQMILTGEALNSVNKIIELRDNSDSPGELQRKAANDLLNRLYGMPSQPYTHKVAQVENLSDEGLDAFIAKSRIDN